MKNGPYHGLTEALYKIKKLIYHTVSMIYDINNLILALLRRCTKYKKMIHHTVSMIYYINNFILALQMGQNWIMFQIKNFDQWDC